MRTIKFWILGIFGSVYAGLLVYGVIALVAVWRSGDWLQYWTAFLSGAPFSMSIAKIAAIWEDSRAKYFVPVAKLRQAIRDGDETVAPVAQMSQAPTSYISADPGRLGPLRRPASAGTVATLWGIAVLALLVPCVGVPLAFAAGFRQLVLFLAAAGLIPGLVCILLGWRFLSPLFVRVDPDGLRWRRPLGLAAFMAWRDAKSFFSLTYARPFAIGRETLYVLDCGSATLAWRARVDTKLAASLHSPSLKLLRLITEHTGLPLRDVTAQARQIAGQPVVALSYTSGGASIRVNAARPSKEEVRRRLRVAGIALSPYLIVALVSLGAMLAQAPYYEHLYAQALSHTALYRDLLSRADGDWPGNSFSSFDQGVYHFQRTENEIYLTYVVAPHRYDHALVEVSGRTGGGYDLGGVGLAIAGPTDPSPLLTFRVTPDGSWWIERLATMEAYQPDNSVRIGDMSAIHRGFGVYNRIAVLINGSDFTFYVNGHYAAGYHDDVLKGGEICLYLDVTSDSGDFSNFAVYPL